jgi:hypothetical protein
VSATGIGERGFEDVEADKGFTFDDASWSIKS